MPLLCHASARISNKPKCNTKTIPPIASHPASTGHSVINRSEQKRHSAPTKVFRRLRLACFKNKNRELFSTAAFLFRKVRASMPGHASRYTNDRRSEEFTFKARRHVIHLH